MVPAIHFILVKQKSIKINRGLQCGDPFSGRITSPIRTGKTIILTLKNACPCPHRFAYK